MKNIFTLFLSLFLLPFAVFAQLDTTLMVEYQYNADVARYLVKEKLSQQFSGNVRTEKSIKEFTYSDGENQVTRSRKEVHNDSGQLLLSYDSLKFYNGWRVWFSEYFYQGNQLNELFSYEKMPTDELLYLDNRTRFFYNSAGLLERTEMIAENESGSPALRSVRAYFYNENGCLQEEIREVTDGIQSRDLYELDENCKVITETNFSKDDLGEYQPFKKISHHEFFMGENRTLVDSVFYRTFQTGTIGWRFGSMQKRTFDASGRLIRNKQGNGDFSCLDQKWTYSSSGEILQLEESTVSSGDTTLVTYKYRLDFDENGYLIRKVETTSGEAGDFESEILAYENYCDGHPKFIMQDVGELTQKRFYFEYRAAEDCPEALRPTAINVYPNPNDGKITIQTDALQGRSSYVRVYTLLGQLVFEQHVPDQRFELNVELSHLNRGNYLVAVIGEHSQMVEKIVIRADK